MRIFHKECTSLARAGYDVTLVAPADFRERVVDGVRVLGVPPPRDRPQRALVWLQILKRLRRERPDLVHSHDPELLLFARLFRPARLVYDCHEFVAAGMLTRPWIPRPLRPLLAALASRMEPLLARQVDRIVVAAPGQTELFARAGRPTTLLHNFPPPGRQPRERRSDGKTLIHVGAHAEVRGCRDMIEAVRRVRLRIAGVRLLLVGPFNHRPYEAEMRRLILEYGLEETVQLVGAVPYQDLPDWLARADVGLVAIRPTPQHVGSIATKLFDYMMAGIPVVATNLPESRRFVEQAQCGLLVRPEDPESMATAIVTVLEDRQLARAMGANGRRAYEERFNWASEEKKLLALYEGLGARPTARS